MGSSRNRGPPSASRDEDPYWDSEDPPKPWRKHPRTYSMLFIIKNPHKPSSRRYFSQVELISGVEMHIFRHEIWCIEDGGADWILQMEVLTIRDVFILNFAPVSLSVSTPRTPRVCHAFQQQATDNCRVGQTATQDMSCIQSKVCSTAQELTGSQHSSWNIVHKLSPAVSTQEL